MSRASDPQAPIEGYIITRKCEQCDTLDTAEFGATESARAYALAVEKWTCPLHTEQVFYDYFE
jgi:hypothetical protein